MPKAEKSKLSQFFRKDHQIVQDFLSEDKGEEAIESTKLTLKESLATLRVPEKVSEQEEIKYWIKLRSFFRNGHDEEGLSPDLAPFILAPMYIGKLIVADYPIWIPSKFDSTFNSCLSLKELIIKCIHNFAPEDNDASILKENIDILVRLTYPLFSKSHKLLFPESKDTVLKSLENQLEVKGDEARKFSADLDKLSKELPNHGYLVSFSNQTSWHLFSNAMQQNVSPIRNKIRAELKILVNKLKELLNLETMLNSGIEPEVEEDSFSFASSMVNFDEINTMSPKDASEGLGEIRTNRIAKALSKLEQWNSILDSGGYIFIEENLRNRSEISWTDMFEDHFVENCTSETACQTVEKCFDKTIKGWEELFKFKRIAELELKNAYRENAHDDFFDHYNWQHFSDEELQACPSFVLLAEDDVLFQDAFHSIFNLLSRSIPIRIIAIRNLNKTLSNLKHTDESLHTPVELGALMLSHKNIFVHQGTSVTPRELSHGFSEGLKLNAPSFFYLLEDPDAAIENNFLKLSAAIEGRDFPGFTFSGLLGTPWSSRFDILNNPQEENEWPLHQRKIKNTSGEEENWELAFTYPEFLVLDKQYKDQFTSVPAEFWDDDLITVDQYLQNGIAENIGKVPFIWMTDDSNTLHKVAVSWQVIMAARERLDFWRFLQENSGINNFHVLHAIEKTKKELQEGFEKQMQLKETEHQEEIEKVKVEEAENVMGNLTSVLLDLDFSSNAVIEKKDDQSNKISSGSEDEKKNLKQEIKPVVNAKPKPMAEAKKEVLLEIEEVEDILTNDPYIDTAMCTSCNECIERNGAMFKYNADKMAYIADPKAGTFKDLVEAAEACPVAVIHPGSPINSAEPGLDDLIDRAKKFN